MKIESPVLTGGHVRLEPIGRHHLDGLVAAAAADPSLYEWSSVPQGREGFTAYIDTALAWLEAGSAVTFATIRLSDNAVIGSSRFWNFDRWQWPQAHPRRGKRVLDGCEIGYTWYTRSAIRTAANTDAKLLMLTHAFGPWNALRVCFHTDARNKRSGAALERIGAKHEGLMRAHRYAPDHTARDSMRYSITIDEWPEVKERLEGFLRRG
jgi:N-acetyltransferase